MRKHNIEYKEGKQTYSMGVNSLSDLTHEEFMHTYNTFRAPLLKEFLGESDNSLIPSSALHNKVSEGGETRIYSYYAKKIVNSTHEEIETKYIADIIKNPSDSKFSSLPSAIDWRQKVKVQYIPEFTHT